MKTALISGATGQDGSYLIELLLEKNYKVFCIVRHSANPNFSRIKHVLDKVTILEADLTDPSSLREAIRVSDPDEVYNLAAQSFVGLSWKQPELTSQITGIGCLNFLQALKEVKPTAKFYQASSSEMFGKVHEVPQKEDTVLHPRSPYGVAKVFAHYMTINYRESYGMFCTSGILFNHEGPRRGLEFVTRKISNAVARIKLGLQSELRLGNLDAQRDWGHAKDYCINKDVPVLTPNGWKFYSDLNIGDEVINFNTHTGNIERDIVINKIENRTNGEKVLLKGRNSYINVTPDHRILYKKVYRHKKNYSEWRFCTALEFHQMVHNKSHSVKYSCALPDFFGYQQPDLEGVIDPQLYLIGMLLAEGCLDSGNSERPGNGVSVSLSQSKIQNKKVYNKILSTLELLSFSPRERVRNDGLCEWIFNAEDSRKILTWFDTPNVHRVPKYFYSLSRRQAHIVFEAMMDGDGSWGSLSYHSKKSELAADFQSIAHLSGYNTTQLVENSNNMWIVYVISARKRYNYITESKVYNDGVSETWCITTKNGTMITRDSGTINVIGNCEAMYLMMQQPQADDYVVATGETHSVREFVKIAFEHVGLNWEEYVVVDPAFFRPAEVDLLIGDPTKAKTVLGWEPKISFDSLVKEMVDYDLEMESLKMTQTSI
jgi:GDP-D-mannose dehydratase